MSDWSAQTQQARTWFELLPGTFGEPADRDASVGREQRGDVALPLLGAAGEPVDAPARGGEVVDEVGALAGEVPAVGEPGAVPGATDPCEEREPQRTQ